MASFDPSVIGGIADSGVQSQKDALTLYDDKNRVQLNSLNLQQAKEEQTDRLAIKDIAKQSDLSTDKGKNEFLEKASKISPDISMKLQKEMGSIQGQNLDNELKKAQVVQEQVTPMVNSIDSTLGALAPSKKLFDEGKITQAELDGRAKKEMLPQILRLKMDKPELGPYLDQFLSDPQKLTYQGLVAAENQTKNGRDMAKQRESEIKDAQRQQQLDQNDKRLTGYLANVAGLNQKRQADIADKKNRAVDPETAKFIAQQYVDTGDKSVFTGMGRTAGDMAVLRKAVREYAQETDPATGKPRATPAQVSAKVAEFNGYMSEERALGNRQAAIDTAAGEAAKVIPIALEASNAVPRSDWVPVNKIVQQGKIMTSNKELAKFGQANLTLANVYSRAMNPTGAATVSGRDHALEQLSTATSQDAYDGVIDIISQEIDAALAAPPEIRKEVQEEIASGGKLGHESIMQKLMRPAAADAARRPGQQTSGPKSGTTGLTPSKGPAKPKTDYELLKAYGAAPVTGSP